MLQSPHGLHCNRRRMTDVIRTPNLIRRILTLPWDPVSEVLHGITNPSAYWGTLCLLLLC